MRVKREFSTVKEVVGIKIPESGERVEYSDTTMRSLLLRVGPGGKKWVVWWRKGQRKFRITIGQFPSLSLADARIAARAKLAAVDAGQSPTEERRERKAAPTFKALANEYIERWAKTRKRAKGAREDQLRIERILIPRWGSMKAQDLRKRDVVALLDEYTKRGTLTARNRMQVLVSKIFNFGLSRDAVESNPVTGIDHDPAGENVDTRFLTDDELRIVLPLLRAEGQAGLGLLFMLLTAARPKEEIFRMKWSEIDGDVWHLPAERSKNGRASTVPLSLQAQQVLDELRKVNGGSDWVFVSPRGDGAFTAYEKAGIRIRAAAALKVPWKPYHLKATCLTGLQSLGCAPHIVSAIANHVGGSGMAPSTAHYAHFDFGAEKLAALNAWGAHVATLEAPQPAVANRPLPFKRKARK